MERPARAAAGAGAGLLGAVEAVEDALPMLRRYTGTRVRHGGCVRSLDWPPDTVMVPPAGVWRRALSRRAVIT